jgi:DNA-binding response OmpR family regulator
MHQTVLIVDDDPTLRLLVKATLQDEQLTLEEAATGEQALRLVYQINPDLVILDVSLPDMSGLHVCRRLRANPVTRRVPVIMLSAHGQPDDREQGLAAGADAYLGKPFSPLQLLQLCELYLRHESVLGLSTRARSPGLFSGDFSHVY